MSEENVEIVRRLNVELQASLERGDPGAWLDSDAVAVDFEWVAIPGAADRDVYRGRDGFVEFMRDFSREFEHWSFQLERLIDAGDDRVVSVYRHRAIGKASGAPVEWQMASVAELKDGRVIRSRNYASPEDAFEAAGLRR